MIGVWTRLNDSLALQTATVNVSDTISGATGTFKVYKFGKVCTVVWSNINGLNHASWASNSMIAYLPNGFRPIVEVSKDPVCGGAYAAIHGKLIFHTGGAIQVTSPNAITDITNGCITYITS